MERHHRKPRSRGGNGKWRNISKVDSRYHRAYHLLFCNMQPEEIAAVLNDVWIDPDYKLIAIRRQR